MGWNKDDGTEENDFDLGFDINEVNPDDAPSYDVIKSGDYRGMVSGGEMKNGSKEGSRYAAITATLTDEKAPGRKMWGNFTTHNQNAKAVVIGRAQLAGAFRAAGVETSSLADLVASQAEMIIVVGFEKGKDGYPDKNVIKGFKPLVAATKTDKPAGEAGEKDKPATTTKPSTKPSFLKKA